MNAVERILTRLERVKPTGPGRWMAACPCQTHVKGDRSRSLSVRETPDGAVLIKCFAGDGAAEVVAALGLALSDLFEAKSDAGASGMHRRGPRVPWGDIFEAVRVDLEVMSLAFTDLARGVEFSPVDAIAISRRAAELSRVIAEVRNAA